MIRQYTTPTLNITLRYHDGTIADDLVFDYLIFTLKSACYEISRQVLYEEVKEGKFKINFTQEETAKMHINEVVEMELNFFDNDKRFATNIQRMQIDRNLLNRVIRE